MGTGYAGLVAVDAYRMRAAIYTVSKDGKEIARLPSPIWVRLAEPGLYLVCGEFAVRVRSWAGRYTTSGGALSSPEKRP